MSNVTKTCAVTKYDFTSSAVPLEIVVNGIPLYADPKQFKTGSFGYYFSGKVNVKLPNGKVVPIQCGFNMIVVNSGEAAPGGADKTEGQPSIPAVKPAGKAA